MPKMSIQKQISNQDLAAENLALRQQLNAIRQNDVAVSKTIKSDLGTFDGEQIVGKVIVAFRNAYNGMTLFKGTQNYSAFVPQKWADKVPIGKVCVVTLHTSKRSGKTTHAIRFGRKAAAYAKVK